MDVLLAVCLIIATGAVVIIAYMATRAVKDFENVANEFKRTAEQARISLAEADRVTKQLGDLTTGFEGVLAPLKRSAMRVEELTDRATELSASVLDEVRRPLETTMSLIRGFRAGTRSLVGALTRSRRQPETNHWGDES